MGKRKEVFVITEEEAIRLVGVYPASPMLFILPMGYFKKLSTRQRVSVLETKHIEIVDESLEAILKGRVISGIITNHTEIIAKYRKKYRMIKSVNMFKEGYVRFSEEEDYPLGKDIRDEQEYAIYGDHAFVANAEGKYSFLAYPKVKGTLITARNAEQAIAINRLNKHQKNAIHLITGSYGSGKTYLTSAYALATGRKINYITTNKTVKDATEIGFIPGSLEDKSRPSIAPLMDIVGTKAVEKMLEDGKLEIIPLAYLRGRNLEGITICSEAQNLTRSHLALLIGRIAEDGVLIIEGDQKQKDIKEKSGIDFLKELEEVHYTHLPAIERSKVAKLAEKLLEV